MSQHREEMDLAMPTKFVTEQIGTKNLIFHLNDGGRLREDERLHSWVELKSLPYRDPNEGKQELINRTQFAGANIIYDLQIIIGSNSNGNHRYTTHTWACSAGVYLKRIMVNSLDEQTATNEETETFAQATFQRISALNSWSSGLAPPAMSKTLDPRTVALFVAAGVIGSLVLYVIYSMLFGAHYVPNPR